VQSDAQSVATTLADEAQPRQTAPAPVADDPQRRDDMTTITLTTDVIMSTPLRGRRRLE
jgi:hypothetical protein